MNLQPVAACVSVCLLATVLPAGAVPITFEFSGTITRVTNNYGYLNSSVAVGEPFSGYYTFESTMVDSNPSPYRGDYTSPSDPLLLMSVQLGNYFITEPLGGISLEDGKDLYSAGTTWFDFLGLQTGMGIRLTDLDGWIIMGDQLPLTPPPITTLPSYWREFSLVGGNGYFGVGGTLETLAPEPSSLMFILLTSCLVFSSRRRQLWTCCPRPMWPTWSASTRSAGAPGPSC